MKKQVNISIVIPCYNEAECLPSLFEEMEKVCGQMNEIQFEIISVDDGSTDETLSILKEQTKRDKKYGYLSFSRNFGKEAALLAGLNAATGDFVTVLDADMQDPPSLLPDLFSAVKSGEFDCAATRRVTRKGEPALRSFFARRFYKLMAGISDAHIVDGARDFRMMSRQMVDAILSLKEYNRFSKGIFSWVGFKTKYFDYENINRKAGKTKWSFRILVKYSIEGIIAFSSTPLILASILGIMLFFISLISFIVIIIKTLIWGDPVAGYPLLMSAIFFIGGIQLFSTGILGQYLARTYLETKKRPIFLIKEKSAK